LEIYHVPNGDAENLLMAYLPKEKILFITDILNIYNQFNEIHQNDPPPGIVSPYTAALGERIKQLNLDVKQVAAAHAIKVVPAEVLWKALKGTVQIPPP